MASELIDFEHTESTPTSPTPYNASTASITLAPCTQPAQEPLPIHFAFEEKLSDEDSNEKEILFSATLRTSLELKLPDTTFREKSHKCLIGYEKL